MRAGLIYDTCDLRQRDIKRIPDVKPKKYKIYSRNFDTKTFPGHTTGDTLSYQYPGQFKT